MHKNKTIISCTNVRQKEKQQGHCAVQVRPLSTGSKNGPQTIILAFLLVFN